MPSRAPRKLGYTHMAFYRGWLQGLPLQQMAKQYLESGTDPRAATSTLRWIQDTLRQAALRHGHAGEARLLRLRIQDVRHVSWQAPSVPSIGAFRESFDPGNFYTYDDLLRHYLERYPKAAGDRKEKRRSALIERQLQALVWIENLLTTTPVPNDPVRAWFDPGIAKRLEGGGIERLRDLTATIANRGYRWYRKVPQLGERRAVRLLQWLASYEAALGPIPAYARKPPKATPYAEKQRPARLVLPAGALAATDGAVSHDAPDGGGPAALSIVPFEAALLPSREGPAPPDRQAPAEGRHITATNDKEAIQAWLDVRASGSAATARAYRKEAERLLLWTYVERHRTFASLGVDDCSAYRDWLGSLGRVDEDKVVDGKPAWPYNLPSNAWFAPRWTRRYSPAWRPFEGPLSARSAQYALTVCGSLFAWLATVGYLAFDPWQAVGKTRPADGSWPDTELTRALSARQWKTLMGAVSSIEDADRRSDGMLLLRLALVTGMRLSELAGARTKDVYARESADGGVRWMLNVLGKGSRWRAVPLTDDVMRLLRGQLRRMGLPDDPRSAPGETPIVASQTGGPMTHEGVAWRIRMLFDLGKAAAETAGNKQQARVFSRASAHWLRHTTGAMLGNHHVPPSQIQKLLGHASITTTGIYTDTGHDELFASVNRVLGESETR